MAMTGLAREENSDIIAEINITPLTDIFLVLLIIFMITSSAIVESGGKVNLPSAVKTQSEPRGTTVTITPRHEIYVNQKKVTEASLENSLREVLNTSPDKIVILRGDREVLLGEAVRVLSIVKKAGASEIAIAAEVEKKGS
ncbi:MAG: biopolymer transporter ExbD [Candidatus Binatota bacterium]